jgi:outer membrane receptor for ferrienterochelin and colicins
MAEIAESIDSTRDVATVRWFHAPSGTFDYTFTLGWADTNRDTYYGGGMDPNAYGTTENPLLTADLQFNHRLGDHFLTLGLQHSRDKLTDTQPAYDRFVEDTYSNTGLYIQDDWFFAKGWELVIGARVDDFSELDDPIVSPRGALRYAPRPDLTFRAAVATGFRGPQVFDEDLHITIVGGEGQVIRNASDLEDESSFSTTLGVEWTPVTDMGVGLVEFNLFQTDIDDLFLVIEDDDPLTDDQEFTRINFGEAAVKGFEINIGWSFSDGFTLELGYVNQSSTYDEPDPDFGSENFARTPDQYGVISATWTPDETWSIWAGGRSTGEMEVPHYAGFIDEDRLETSPTFFTLDLRIAKEFALTAEPTTRLKVSLGGRNLTDDFQEDFDQGPDRDAGYVYGPRFPRSFYLSLGVAF